MGLCRGYIGAILGLYRDNGKENGNSNLFHLDTLQASLCLNQIFMVAFSPLLSGVLILLKVCIGGC